MIGADVGPSTAEVADGALTNVVGTRLIRSFDTYRVWCIRLFLWLCYVITCTDHFNGKSYLFLIWLACYPSLLFPIFVLRPKGLDHADADHSMRHEDLPQRQTDGAYGKLKILKTRMTPIHSIQMLPEEDGDFVVVAAMTVPVDCHQTGFGFLNQGVHKDHHIVDVRSTSGLRSCCR